MNCSLSSRIKILKAFLFITAILLLFWWPLSHWLYPDWYHHLMGFKPGSYQESMVKMIGTCGFFPVFLAFFAARDPLRYKASIVTLILTSVLIGLTFLYLILTNSFPEREAFNIALSFFVAGFLCLMYPWRESWKSGVRDTIN